MQELVSPIQPGAGHGPDNASEARYYPHPYLELLGPGPLVNGG